MGTPGARRGWVSRALAESFGFEFVTVGGGILAGGIAGLAMCETPLGCGGVPFAIMGFGGIVLGLGVIWIQAIRNGVETPRPGAASVQGFPQTPRVAMAPACVNCGGPLEWAPQFGRWYCPREQRWL